MFTTFLYKRYILENKSKLIFTFLQSAVETNCLLQCAMWKHDATIRLEVRMCTLNLSQHNLTLPVSAPSQVMHIYAIGILVLS
jgi:hypothetical protein